MDFHPDFLTRQEALMVLRRAGKGRQKDADVRFLPQTQGKGLIIDWDICEGEIGAALVAVSEGAICGLYPADLGRKRALHAFRTRWAKTALRRKRLPLMKLALRANPPALPLLLTGTSFQHLVWELLLKIPRGQLVRYGDLAAALDQPRAARAVGNAVGQNPVAWLVPCHRVGHSDGGISGFAAGEACKRRWLALETA